jgi:hypothetical protein
LWKCHKSHDHFLDLVCVWKCQQKPLNYRAVRKYESPSCPSPLVSSYKKLDQRVKWLAHSSSNLMEDYYIEPRWECWLATIATSFRCIFVIFEQMNTLPCCVNLGRGMTLSSYTVKLGGPFHLPHSLAAWTLAFCHGYADWDRKWD